MADKWKDQRADWQAKRVDKKHGPGDKQIDRLQRRLDRDEQWFADWVSGLSHREIAEKYDVHIRTVAGWASAHRWRERRADLRRELFEAKEKARLATAPPPAIIRVEQRDEATINDLVASRLSHIVDGGTAAVANALRLIQSYLPTGTKDGPVPSVDELTKVAKLLGPITQTATLLLKMQGIDPDAPGTVGGSAGHVWIPTTFEERKAYLEQLYAEEYAVIERIGDGLPEKVKPRHWLVVEAEVIEEDSDEQV